MHVERLNFLAQALRKNAANPTGAKFDLSSWLNVEMIHTKSNIQPPPAIDCGTTACAMGLACLLPEFQEQGLTLKYGAPHFKGYNGFAAASYFFEISTPEAHCLFSDGYYPKDKHKGAVGEIAVAEKIEALLSGESIGQRNYIR